MMKTIWLVVCCLLFIVSCGTKKTYVATPPDTVRKVNATQRPYTVNGKRYKPLATHEGFVQTGIASWYGKDFHGKKTSNGETYDMHGMTAAHKTLPLGVFIKVYNRDNGREAVVRVNDRGPFVKGRIIDLSYAAAKSLGVDIAGTAPVRIEALGYRYNGKGGYSAPENYGRGNYTVQIGSFREYANASKLSIEMKRHYGFSETHTTNVNGESYYRVYAGKYKSLEEAEAAEEAFSEDGYPGSFAVALD